MSDVSVDKRALIEGERPVFNAGFGKLMMWFFLVSDAFTFSALLITYGALRVSAATEGYAWANPEEVFTHTPILYDVFHIEAPLVFVGIMTFILILSSVTMVLAVEAGHRKSQKEVSRWVFLTMLGGLAFVSCQAYEWYHFIEGTHEGAYRLEAGALDALNIPGAKKGEEAVVYPVKNTAHEIIELRLASNGALITGRETIEKLLDDAEHTEGGAGLRANQYGPPAFADLFFFVTGFHGTHVFSGVVLLFILWINTRRGVFERRGHYEMTEKIGLYWHFVDLVWVFVFTFFYLV